MATSAGDRTTQSVIFMPLLRSLKGCVLRRAIDMALLMELSKDRLGQFMATGLSCIVRHPAPFANVCHKMGRTIPPAHEIAFLRRPESHTAKTRSEPSAVRYRHRFCEMPGRPRIR